MSHVTRVDDGITVTGRKEIIATKLLTEIFSMDKVFYICKRITL
jgi:hypothetical protein